MKRSLIHQRIKQTALAVPAAALMLGAAHAGTTVGLNFQTWYYDSGNNPQTIGFNNGYSAYNTTGFPVTAKAFGLNPSSWFNTDPLFGNPNGAGNPINQACTFGGASTTFAGGLSCFVNSPIGGFQSGSGCKFKSGITYPSYAPGVFCPQGQDEALWGIIVGKDASPFSVSVSGLAAKFPNGYVIQSVAALGNGLYPLLPRVDFTDNVTTNTAAYHIWYIYNAPNAQWPTTTGGISDPSGTFTNDTLYINSRADGTGLMSCLAGFIVTDQPVVSQDPVGGSYVTGQTINLSVGAIGISTLSYQWRSNGIPISGATSASYTAPSSSVGTFNYDVIVTNLYGSATSDVATVSVAIPATLTWDANTGTTGAQDGSGTWDNGVTANWWNGSSDVGWSDLGNAIFDSGGSGAYTVTIVSNITANTLTFGSANYTVTGTNTLAITLGGSATITVNTNTTISAVLAGASNVTKNGPGTLTLTTGNSLTGNLTVSGGTVQGAVSGQAFYLGSVVGNRTITVNSGSSINISNNNVFGGGGYSAAALPAVVLNGGTFFSSRYNSIGNVTLNSGGTLSQSASDSGSYLGYQFLGTITAGGSSPSTISTGNGKGNHLLGGGVNVFNVADVTGDANPDLIVSAPLVNGSGDYTGIGSIVKTGAGTLLLSGVSTYTGTTTVSNGTLAVSGQLTGGGNLTLDDGAGLSVSATLGVVNIATTLLSIGNSGTGANTLTFANLDSTSTALISAGGGVAITNPVTVNITGNITAVGTYPLISYAGESGPGSFVLGSLPAGVSATLTDDHSSTLSLNVTVTPVQTEVWNGSPNGNWNVNNTANWTIGGVASKWFDSNIAEFDDTASGTTAITLNTNVYPSVLNFSNLVKSYSISGTGAIAGATSLYLIGTGTTTLSTTNTYSGGTFINSGTLAISSDANLGSGPINLNGGTLDLTGTTAFASGKTVILNNTSTIQVDNTAGASFTPVISGNGSLTKTGNGTLTLGAQETFTGGTTVNAGTLVLSYGGASGTLQGTLTINPNATVITAVNNALGYSGNNWVQNITINYGTLATSVTTDNGWGTTINMTGGTLGTLVPNGYFAMGNTPSFNITGGTIPSVISADLTVRDAAGITFSLTRGTAPVDLNVTGKLRPASAGGITVSGSGIMQLSAVNSYTGPTEVQGGKLILTGQLTGGGAVTVDDSSEFDVVGGLSSAIVATGDLTLGSGGTVTLGFANISSPTVPLVSVANVALNDVTTVNISGKVGVGQFPLIKYSGATNGTGSFVLGTLPPGVSATLSNNVVGQSFDLVVTAAPLSIITDISSGTNYAYAGANYNLVVAAGGTPTLGYRWFHNNTLIPGANSASLTLSRISSANNGSYYLIVTNGSGSISSSTNNLVVLPVSGYPAMTIATGPTAYWPLNETNGPTATDYMGGHNASYSGSGVTYSVPGPVGSVGITLSGGTVVAPYSADLNPSGPFTVECWIKPLDLNSGNRTLVANMINGQTANANDRSGWLLRQNGATLTFLIGDNSTTTAGYSTTATTPSVLTAGVWQHVVTTYNSANTNVTIFVNGSQVLSVAGAKQLFPNFAAPTIIGDRGYGGWGYNGSISQAALYSRLLTQQEIQTHAQDSPALQIAPAGSKEVISWVPSGGGSLLASPTVNGTYTNVPAATSPWTNTPTGSQQFYRVGF